MAMDFVIQGETLVQVKGPSDSPVVAALAQLGLAESDIIVTFTYNHETLGMDAWGKMDIDEQVMGATARISMRLIYYDNTVLDECIRLSMGAPPTVGQVARAGQRLGNNQPQFGAAPGNPPTGYNAGNSLISLNMTSPVAGLPYHFPFTFLSEPPVTYRLGTKRSVTDLNWKAIVYSTTPYNNGLGAYGQTLYNRILDG